MSTFPPPPIPLAAGPCAALYNQTLYAYQWNAFQALELCPHGNWTALTPGIALNDTQCVLGQSDGQDALFVVGGTTADPSAAGYPGLQRYLFKDKRWATNAPLEGKSIVQNRSRHGAAWIAAGRKILVYAGGQDGRDEMSSQTFTIAADAPYTMRSFTARAPPAKRPLLVSWNATHVAMLGGQAEESREVWLFGEATGWQKLDGALPRAIGDTGAVRAAVLRGADGGATLETFDLGRSPSQVDALVVQGPPKRDLGRRGLFARSLSHRRSAHSLSPRQAGGLPAYNDTFAPTAPRADFALAADPAGLIAIAGGTSAGAADAPPLALFNGTGNAWLDPAQVYNPSPPAPQHTLHANPTDAPISATQTARPSATPSADGGGGPDARTVLGGVLGGLFGLGALIVLALLFLRYRRRRRRQRAAEAQRRRDGLELDKELAVDSPAGGGALGAGAAHSRTSSFGNAGHLPGIDRSPSRADDGWSRYFVNDAAPSAGGVFAGSADGATRPETGYTASEYDSASRPGSAFPPAHLRPATQLHPAYAGAGGALASVPERRNSRARTPPSPGSNPENYLHPRAHAAAAWDPLAAPGTPSHSEPTASSGSEPRVRPGDFPAVPGSTSAASSSFGGAGASAHAGANGFGGMGGVGGRAPRQWGLGNSWREGERGLRTLAGRELTGVERGPGVGGGGAVGGGGRVGMGVAGERCTQFVPRPATRGEGGGGGGGGPVARPETRGEGGPAHRPEDMSWLNLGR